MPTGLSRLRQSSGFGQSRYFIAQIRALPPGGWLFDSVEDFEQALEIDRLAENVPRQVAPRIAIREVRPPSGHQVELRTVLDSRYLFRYRPSVHLVEIEVAKNHLVRGPGINLCQRFLAAGR